MGYGLCLPGFGVGGECDRGCFPGQALSGAIACTAPAHGGGGGAPKARVGWGSSESGVWGDAEGECDWGSPPVAPFPGYRHDGPRSGAGQLWKGQYGSFQRGGGCPSPVPTPGRYPPRSGAWGDAGGECDRDRLPGQALSGAIACTAPAHGGGGGAPKARVGWGR